MDFRDILMVAATQGGGAAAAVNPMAGLFNINLRTGTGAAANVTGIPFAPDLYIGKSRSASTAWGVYDTVRGATIDLTIAVAAETTQVTGLTAFNSDGVLLGALAKLNTLADTYVDFMFKKVAHFMDIVSYTGTGLDRTIAHSLGEAPGFMIVKRRDAATQYRVWHRSLADATNYLEWNSTNLQLSNSTMWNSTAPDASVFSVGTNSTTNNDTSPFIAYLFGQNNDSIQCGAVTVLSGSDTTVSGLPFAPQFLILKRIDAGGAWNVLDTTRGWAGSTDKLLLFNTGALEGTATDYGAPSSDGFTIKDGSFAAGSYVYVAIRA